MAAINELAEKFDKMTLTQKKSFVLNLKKQVEASNNPSHKKFLNECIQKYNAEFQASSQQKSAPTRSATSAVADNLPPLPEEDDLPPLPDETKPSKKKTKIIAIIAAVLGVVVLLFVIDALINLIQTRQAEEEYAARRAEEERIIDTAFGLYLDGYPEKTVREAFDDYFVNTLGLNVNNSAYSTGDDVYNLSYDLTGFLETRNWPSIFDEILSRDDARREHHVFLLITFEYDATAQNIKLSSIRGRETSTDSDFIKKFLDLIYSGSEHEIKFYAENPDVPDYGATFGIDAVGKDENDTSMLYLYHQSDIDSVRDQYGIALADFIVEHGFVFDSVTTLGGELYTVYRKGATELLLNSTDDIVSIIFTKRMNANQSNTYTSPPNMSNSQIEDEVARIRELWQADRAAMDGNRYTSRAVAGGGVAYFDGTQLKMIEIARGTDFVANSADNTYSRTYQYHNGNLIFAYLTEATGGSAHRLYFKDGSLFRWRHTQDNSRTDDSIDYDLRVDLAGYNYLHELALKEATELYALAGGYSGSTGSTGARDSTETYESGFAKMQYPDTYEVIASGRISGFMGLDGGYQIGFSSREVPTRLIEVTYELGGYRSLLYSEASYLETLQTLLNNLGNSPSLEYSFDREFQIYRGVGTATSGRNNILLLTLVDEYENLGILAVYESTYESEIFSFIDNYVPTFEMK